MPRKRVLALDGSIAPTTGKAPARLDNGKGNTGIQTEIRLASELLIWMKNYASWLALCPVEPTWQDRVAMIAKLSGKPASKDALQMLERRPDFQALWQKLRADEIFAVQQQVRSK